MSFYRNLAAVVMGVCLGCAAQSQPSQQSAPAAPKPSGPAMADAQLARRIENQLRAHFGVPAQVTVRVGAPHASEFPGYNALTVTISDPEKSKDYEFLLSKDNKTLARLTTLDITKDPFEETMAKIDTTGRPVRGNKEAKVTIVNYDDFECPFCAQMHQTMTDVVKKFGDQIRVIYKDYPLSEIHPWAERAAVDSNCLAAQNGDAFWDFADYVHANQGAITGKEQHRTQAGMNEAVDKVTLDIGRKRSLNEDALQACVKNQSQKVSMEKSVEEASHLDVSATPTMFVNGERLEGLVSEDALVDVIKKHLQDQPGAASPGK